MTVQRVIQEANKLSEKLDRQRMSFSPNVKSIKNSGMKVKTPIKLSKMKVPKINGQVQLSLSKNIHQIKQMHDDYLNRLLEHNYQTSLQVAPSSSRNQIGGYRKSTHRSSMGSCQSSLPALSTRRKKYVQGGQTHIRFSEVVNNRQFI